MLFKRGRIRRLSTAWRIGLAAVGWLILISWLHAAFNVDRAQRPLILMGYMPVITNMAAPLLDYASKDGVGLRFEALKFSSFSEMGEALRNGHIQAAFIIAPLSIVLHQQQAGVKIVYIGNRHESTLVFRNTLDAKTFADLRGKTIAVPLRYSGHNIAARRLAEEYGLTGSDLKIVEMNPPDMPSALAIGALDAYFVGEPFGAMTIRSGVAKVLHYVEQVWPGFICNLVLVRDDLINKHPDRVKDLVQGAARAGYWAREHPEEAARIIARYWNQSADFVEYALTTPPNRIVYDRFLPKEEEIQFLADQMVKYSLLENNNISGLVDDRFAKAVNLEGITDTKSILQAPRN
jgi:NitT/TauT family transport system substrate-binding protein